MKIRFVLAVLCIVLSLIVASAKDNDKNKPEKHAFKTHVPRLSSVTMPHVTGSARAGASTPDAVFNGSQYNVGATVTPTTTRPEAEEEIAVYPNNPSILVAAISDFASSLNTTKFAFSYNNGATWIENYLPQIFGLFLYTVDGFFWLANSDPVVAIDKADRVFISNLYLDAFDNGNGLYVNIGSLAGGVNSISPGFPVLVNPDPNTQLFEDKPWITVDNSNNPATSGNVYLSWSHFIDPNTNYIVVSRSVDHALSWSAPIRISPPALDGNVQGAQVAVGPAGEIYVVYEAFYPGTDRQHFIAKSVNGGLTFSNPVAITPIFNELTFNPTYRVFSLPALAVGPTTGDIVVLYGTQLAANSAIQMVISTNGGASFAAPTTISDASIGQEFFPAVAIDTAGVIHTSWFDTRNSPTNPQFYDIYATFSKDHGVTFAPNTRVNTSIIDSGGQPFIGDYSGTAAGGGFAHPVWTNGGFNNGFLQTAVLTTP